MESFSKLYILGFLLFWLGFLGAAVFWCIKDENYNTIWFTLPFWIVGISLIKRRLLCKQTNRHGKILIHPGIILSVLSILVLLAACIVQIIKCIRNEQG